MKPKLAQNDIVLPPLNSSSIWLFRGVSSGDRGVKLPADKGDPLDVQGGEVEYPDSQCCAIGSFFQEDILKLPVDEAALFAVLTSVVSSPKCFTAGGLAAESLWSADSGALWTAAFEFEVLSDSALASDDIAVMIIAAYRYQDLAHSPMAIVLRRK
nr:hypothetical protein Iba_chr02bCG25370 [Ipomoea batatas]